MRRRNLATLDMAVMEVAAAVAAVVVATAACTTQLAYICCTMRNCALKR
jgi:hypothetical protein